MLGENYLRYTNRVSEITYGGANDTTEQCRERCIHIDLVATLQRDQWERSSVTSVSCNGTPLYHYHMYSYKNSGFENPAKVDREEEGLFRNTMEHGKRYRIETSSSNPGGRNAKKEGDST